MSKLTAPPDQRGSLTIHKTRDPPIRTSPSWAYQCLVDWFEEPSKNHRLIQANSGCRIYSNLPRAAAAGFEPRCYRNLPISRCQPHVKMPDLGKIWYSIARQLHGSKDSRLPSDFEFNAGWVTVDTPAPPKKPVLFDAPVGGGKPMLPERSPGADTDFQTKKRNVLC